MMMMEAARTSETSVDNYFTRQYIPEDISEPQLFKLVFPDIFGENNKGNKISIFFRQSMHNVSLTARPSSKAHRLARTVYEHYYAVIRYMRLLG
jgi:hypothetical protein